MSKANTKPAEKLEPWVSLCETNPFVFLTEVQRLIRLGYGIDFSVEVNMSMVYEATLVLPEA